MLGLEAGQVNESVDVGFAPTGQLLKNSPFHSIMASRRELECNGMIASVTLLPRKISLSSLGFWPQ